MDERPMDRRGFLSGAAGLAVALGAGAAVSAIYRFDVTRPTAALPGLREPVRVALLTDFHFGPYLRAGSVAAWVDAANAARPDLVVIGGDLVDSSAGRDLDALPRALARLTPPLGTYAVWGNHDHRRLRDLAPMTRALTEAGVTVLRNAGALVRPDLYLAGLDDLRTGRPDLAATLADRPDPAVAATVLISHNPDVLPRVPTSVALTLSGHTHGGQIVVPGVGAILTSSAYGRRFASGWVVGPARGYVSRGLGVSWIPVRAFCPAELPVFDLSPAA